MTKPKQQAGTAASPSAAADAKNKKTSTGGNSKAAKTSIKNDGRKKKARDVKTKKKARGTGDTTTSSSDAKKQLEQQEPPFPLYRNHPRLTMSGRQRGDDEHQEQEQELISFHEGIQSVVNLLRKKKRIVVLTGAGISVSCGIPDFRSKNTGLYSTLDAEELGLSCPEELFDFEVFQDNPAPFYQFARHLYFPLGNGRRVQPSDSHKLLALLEEKKMLLRVYSQNIDGLEQKAGVSPRKVVHAHGSLQWAACCKCKRKVDSEQIESDILNGNVALCQAVVGGVATTAAAVAASPTSSVSAGSKSGAVTRRTLKASPPPRESNERSTRKRPRTSEDGSIVVSSGRSKPEPSAEKTCGGVMKPGVTFFGEALHDNVRRALQADRNKVDALIVIGTSLQVAPISKVIGYLPANIPRILINRTIVHPASSCNDDENGDSDSDAHEADKDLRSDYVFDAYLLGYCDDVTRSLAKKLFSSDNDDDDDDDDGCKLLASVQDDDELYNKEDWDSVKVPRERVFLFPGALAPSQDPYLDGDDAGTDNKFREIAHCDGCSKRIVGTIRKCATCFDYDLCKKCFPKISKTHFDGKHHFLTEEASLPPR